MAKMKTNQTVYYGPSSTYPKSGSVKEGEEVTNLWMEGDYSFIEFKVNGAKNCGYVATKEFDYAEFMFPFEPKKEERYINKNTVTYTGPSSYGYAEAGSVNRGEKVWYLGKKSSGYAFIEYDTYGGKKRAYIDEKELRVDPLPNTDKIMKDPTLLGRDMKTMKLQQEHQYMQCVMELLNSHIHGVKNIKQVPILILV